MMGVFFSAAWKWIINYLGELPLAGHWSHLQKKKKKYHKYTFNCKYELHELETLIKYQFGMILRRATMVREACFFFYHFIQHLFYEI